MRIEGVTAILKWEVQFLPLQTDIFEHEHERGIQKNTRNNCKAREEQITAQQKESQLPYKTACEKVGYKVEWNQDSYLAKVGKRWTDCQIVCQQKKLPVEFSKKPKLILKK
jgi:hypothetical protein